jgi:general stress protein YciG
MPRGANAKRKIRRDKSESKTKRPRSKKTATKRSRRAASGGRGFAGMSDQQQRAIAAQGGRAAHARGTAHEFSSAEARKAGRKGGQAVSRDRGHMARIGRKGGEQ